MNKKTCLIIAMVTAAVLFWSIADRSISVFAAATSVTTVEKLNIDTVQFIDCYGEEIHLTFVINLVNRVTFDANGHPHLFFHANLSNFSAVGLTTGTKYAGSQVLNAPTNGEAFTTSEPPWEFTIRSVVNGEGQGTAPNFTSTETVHVTVNANGETTSQIDRSSFTCH